MELRGRLPPEASDWITAADQYAVGEISAEELAEARSRALQFIRDRESDADHADHCAWHVAAFRLSPRDPQMILNQPDETCNFYECCYRAGISNERLDRLIRLYFPAAFRPRPWWRLW